MAKKTKEQKDKEELVRKIVYNLKRDFDDAEVYSGKEVKDKIDDFLGGYL